MNKEINTQNTECLWFRLKPKIKRMSRLEEDMLSIYFSGFLWRDKMKAMPGKGIYQNSLLFILRYLFILDLYFTEIIL